MTALVATASSTMSAKSTIRSYSYRGCIGNFTAHSHVQLQCLLESMYRVYMVAFSVLHLSLVRPLQLFVEFASQERRKCDPCKDDSLQAPHGESEEPCIK
mmetsp:Transcript_35594/g.86217  ORF Transcript_35594/g.86217 Transcript_35594/m.86217 type:complete len:100 (-) Transcript_35594:138-437(-)